MRKSPISILLCWLGFWLAATTWASDTEQILAADEAFQFKADLKNSQAIRLSWEIADGYYLYRQKFEFVSLSPDIAFDEPIFPAGLSKHDKHFGAVEIYRNRLEIELPAHRSGTQPATATLQATFQGCADAGICYMPIQKTISLDFPDRAGSVDSNIMPPNR